MSQRETRILWLKDILEHLSRCQQQLEWADDPELTRVLTDAMIRDLESCQKLCEEIKRKAIVRVA